MSSKKSRKNEDLMVAYQKGDNESLNILFARHREQLVRFARSCVPASKAGKQQLAEDAVQNAFVKVVSSRDRPSFWKPGNAPVINWLFTLVQNEIRNVLRKKSASEKVCSDYESGNGACHSVESLKIVANCSSFELAFNLEQFLSSLNAALSSEVLEVVKLKMKGLSCKEIATALQVSLPTISRRWKTANDFIECWKKRGESPCGLAA